MQRRIHQLALALGLVAAAALTTATAKAADTPSTTGTATNEVTFVNSGNHRIDVYARYGSDASCEAKPKAEKLTVDPGQSQKLASEGNSVCFCLQVPDRNTCPGGGGWDQVKAGHTRHLM